MNTPRPVRLPNDDARAGFTLIEILVVVTIIAAIVGIAVPVYTNVQEQNRVATCQIYMRSIAMSIENYRDRFKRYPSEKSGIQFLLAPWKEKMVDHSEKTIRNMYISPGDDFALNALGDWKETYGDIENIDPIVISYAGRNTKEYPLRRKNATSEIIACTAAGRDGNEMVHKHSINIAYLDMNVSAIDVNELPNQDPKEFKVGPDSPLEQLTKLNKDP